MRRREKSQRVDIDEYFEGFEDFSEPSATKPGWHPAASLVSQPLKALVAGGSAQTYPVLAPYHHRSTILSQPKTLNSFEMEAAHRAITSIKHQLLAEPDPSIQTRVFPPAPTLSLPQHRPVAKRSAHLGRGSAVAILGTMVVALVLYAYSSNRLQPYLAQVSTLGRGSLPKVNLALPAPTVLAKTDRTADQAAMAQAMRLAYTAAELTQSATTAEDWQQVIIFWRRAIDELQPIQAHSPLFQQAQERRQRYEDNLAYAQDELEMAPFRIAVNAAETASDLASSATTPEDWAKVATKWNEALSHMEAVSTSHDRYEVAQTKLAEYATKFAYSQNRYLTLQPKGSR